MVTKLFKVSPTRLGAFGECPRRYYYGYVARPAPTRSGGPWAHQSLGDSVHLALSKWWELPAPGASARAMQAGQSGTARERNFTAAGELLTEVWIDAGYRDPEQSARWLALAKLWIRAYATRQYGRPAPIGCERTVSTVDGDLILEGRIDRLDDRGGRLVTVDYKVGREVPTEQQARSSLALALYAVAAGRMFKRRCARAELHHIPTGTVVAADYDAESIGRHLDRIHSQALDIMFATDTLEGGAAADEVFPPRTSGLCRSCDYRALCPEGQERGPAAEPWAALDRWEVAA
jgi:putative RecB family exonuclease